MGLRRSPSIVPAESENVYLVVDDLGTYGTVFRETATDAADLETIITDMVAGEYHSPSQVICMNVACRRWWRDGCADFSTFSTPNCLRPLPILCIGTPPTTSS